jgi:hypothetical protein
VLFSRSLVVVFIVFVVVVVFIVVVVVFIVVFVVFVVVVVVFIVVVALVQYLYQNIQTEHAGNLVSMVMRCDA